MTLQIATECVSDHGKATCKDINGVCITKRDGYYLISGLCMTLGVVLLITFIIPKARKLQGQAANYKDKSTNVTFGLFYSSSHLCMASKDGMNLLHLPFIHTVVAMAHI
jgi:hypothetical protein